MSDLAAVVQHALSYSLVLLSVYVPALPRDNSDVAAASGPVTTGNHHGPGDDQMNGIARRE